MRYPSSVNYPFLRRQAQWHRIGFALIMIALCVVSGCSATSAKQFYENPEFGISLEKPRNWSLEFYERNGSITLEARGGARNGGSARIEMFGYACPRPFDYPDLETEFESALNRIRTSHGLDSLKVIQEPIKAESHGNVVMKATVAVPTTALPEGSAYNQAGDRDADTFQIIDTLVIRDNQNYSVNVYIYRGSSDELNAEAESIVDSIKFTCSAEQ